MKKSFTLLLVLMVLVAAHAQAQISLPSNPFNPSPGTIIQTANDGAPSQALYDSLSAGNGGPKTWDVSNRAYGGFYSFTVVSPASMPYSDSFPGSNLALKIIVSGDTSWSVQKSSASQFMRTGSFTLGPGISQLIVYKDTSADWVFPLSYGNHWVSFRHWTQNSASFKTRISDTITNVVDAWGTAKYKTKSIPCLRVTSTESYVYQTYNASDSLLLTTTSSITEISFIDASFSTILYVSRQAVSGGSTVYSSYASADLIGSPTDVKEDNRGTLPSKFSLDQNYPNPFNPNTEIHLSLPRASHVRLAVYNVAGQEVKLLVDRLMTAGSYTADWDGTNKTGGRVASGVYFYRMEAAGVTETRKMVLLK